MSQSISRVPAFRAAPALPPRRRSLRTWLTGVLLGLWVLVTGLGLWFALVRPSPRSLLRFKDRRVIVAAQKWFAGVRGELPGGRRALVVLLPGAGCSCQPPPMEAFLALASRWLPHDVGFVFGGALPSDHSASGRVVPMLRQLPGAPKLPHGMNLLLFESSGRLLFGGALSPGRRAGSTIVDLMLERLADGSDAGSTPLLFQPRCDC